MEHVFVEFRAGKMKLEGGRLVSDPRKGLVRLVKVCGWKEAQISQCEMWGCDLRQPTAMQPIVKVIPCAPTCLGVCDCQFSAL